MLDITLNSLVDNEIKEFLQLSEVLLKSNQLNVILIQSLTKFAQLGFDKRSAGLIILLNDASTKLSKTNNKFRQLIEQEKVDDTTSLFFDYFLNYEEYITEYLKQVNNGARYVYDNLSREIRQSKISNNKLQMTTSSDNKPCYIALNLNIDNPKLLFQIQNLSELVDSFKENLFKPLCHFFGLPISERFSIGFPLTSINVVYNSIRLTIGVESRYSLDKYVEILKYSFNLFNNQNIDFLFTKLSDAEFIKS